jgi:hypothetical protein
MTGRCNVCGWSDRFLRLERGREGTACRNCGSTSRNRAVAFVLGRVLDEDQPVFRWQYRLSTRMLESSARGALAMYFRRKFDYYGTEFDPARIAAGRHPRAQVPPQPLRRSPRPVPGARHARLRQLVRDARHAWRRG